MKLETLCLTLLDESLDYAADQNHPNVMNHAGSLSLSSSTWYGERTQIQITEDAQSQCTYSPIRASPVHAQPVRHQDINQAPSSHSCIICGRSFPLSKTLYRHQRTVHQGNPNQNPMPFHKCSICHRSFKRKDILDRHEKHQHGAKKVRCFICGKLLAERCLLEHFKTWSCQTAQLNADSTNVAELKASSLQFLFDTAGRFGLDSVTDPLLVAAQLYNFWRTQIKPVMDSKPSIICPREMHVRHLELIGLLTRTIFRLLGSACPVSTRIQVAIAIGMAHGSIYDVNAPLERTYSCVMENLWELGWIDLDTQEYRIPVEGSTTIRSGIYVYRGMDGDILDCKVGVADQHS